MKRDMSPEEIDDIIRQSLSEEEAKYYTELEEQGVWAQMFTLYKGKMKWWNVFVTAISIVLVGVMVYCLIQFLDATETNDLIKWGAGLFAALIMQSMFKMWSWNQMDKNTILREMKRLEYQISLIEHGHDH